MRREAPTARMITTAVHHARSGMSLLKDVAALAASAAEETVFFLTPLDFVELVPTDISNFFVARKEQIIDRHDQSFKGTNHSVVDTVMIQNLLCIYSTCIHSLDIVFTLNK